jgi:hypothetical protein
MDKEAMESSCHGLLLAGLCALSACDAVGTAPETGQAPQRRVAEQHQPQPAPDTAVASSSTASEAIGALSSQQGLKVGAGDFVLRLTGSGCRKFAGHVVVCDRKNRLEITATDGSIRQMLQPESVFVDSNALVYRGPLDKAGHPDTHTFVMSDANGDGRDDLMIWSGREGAYGGPSFDVYLFDPATSEFKQNQPFSELTVGYLGLFRVEGGRIKTASKSGCCTHVYETYAVEDNVPRLVERVTEDATKGEGDSQIWTERLVDGELKEVKRRQ